MYPRVFAMGNENFPGRIKLEWGSHLTLIAYQRGYQIRKSTNTDIYNNVYVLTSYVSLPSPLSSFLSLLPYNDMSQSAGFQNDDIICPLVVLILWVFIPEKTLWEEYKWFTNVPSLVENLTQ